jgi:hypothetical protein
LKTGKPASVAGFLFWLLLCGDVSAAQLCLTAARGEVTLARFETGPEDEFRLSFVHSVSLTPVTDVYRLTPTGILQTAEIFEAHGAGLPSFSDDIGALDWRHEDGKFILDMARQSDEIHVRVQRDYQNTLHIGAKSIELADLGESVVTLIPCKNEGTE